MRARMKRIWTISDFARHTGVSRRRAKYVLKKLDVKHRGQLLWASRGQNRRFVFFVATLARLEPEMVHVEVPTMEEIVHRIEELEERLEEMRGADKRIALVVGEHTREIEAIAAAQKRPMKRVA
jgi:hypothetical protein